MTKVIKLNVHQGGAFMPVSVLKEASAFYCDDERLSIVICYGTKKEDDKVELFFPTSSELGKAMNKIIQVLEEDSDSILEDKWIGEHIKAFQE